MEYDFSGMPELSDGVKDIMRSRFKNYLFFYTVRRGVREYTCTACHESFTEGKKVLHRTMSANDYALSSAAHNEECSCPLCGARGTVKNIKKINVERLYEELCFTVFLPVSANEVWFRCFFAWRDYKKDLSGRMDYSECMRYYMIPGNAIHWVKYNNEWSEKARYGEAFLWSCGIYSEKYDYEMLLGSDMTKDDTFLKYCAFEKYQGQKYYNIPLMKYLCWYAKHLQVELIVKLGMYEIVDEMVFKNTDNKRLLDWTAKTPWELCRLTKTEFNAWRKINSHTGGDLDALKIYKTLKKRTLKDFEFANNLTEVISRGQSSGILKKVKAFIADCKRFKTDPREVYRYLEKVKRNSAGHCCHCPGITLTQAFDLWGDYINMARALNILYINPMPADLKGEHDALVARIGLKRRADSVAACRESAKKEAPEYRKKYPRAEKVLKSIKALYEYRGEKYSVLAPSFLEDVIFEGNILNHCVGKGKSDRYFDRIQRRESYILFLRDNNAIDMPWYTLEVEPDGVIRQKRTEGDRQDPDLDAAKDFLAQWQKVVRSRIGKKEKALAKASADKRRRDYMELRENGIRIHYGMYAGKLLADVLEKDLMEMPPEDRAEERSAG